MSKFLLQAFIAITLLSGTASAENSMTRLADAHADACVYNYTQCMNGCGGASGCESQCQTNYNGCMGQ